MQIQANKVVTTLSGKPYTSDGKELTVGNVIAEALAGDTTGGKFKLYTLAQKFWNEPEVEVDAADLGLIKTAVENTKTYNNIIIGQVLGLLQ